MSALVSSLNIQENEGGQGPLPSCLPNYKPPDIEVNVEAEIRGKRGIKSCYVDLLYYTQGITSVGR